MTPGTQKRGKHKENQDQDLHQDLTVTRINSFLLFADYSMNKTVSRILTPPPKHLGVAHPCESISS